jgi:rubrerythrin
MDLKDFESSNGLSQEQAKAQLINILQNAYSGEKAAANAYWGHANSLFVTDKTEKEELLEIRREELHHRDEILIVLKSLGSGPNAFKEILMNAIGYVIAILCFPGTWFVPMYGAGQLESKNIAEYEVLARLAYLSDHKDLVPMMLDFAEKEWDHEYYFRQKVLSHKLAHYIPMWTIPNSRESIRQNFSEFLIQGTLKSS